MGEEAMDTALLDRIERLLHGDTVAVVLEKAEDGVTGFHIIAGDGSTWTFGELLDRTTRGVNEAWKGNL